MAMGNNKTYLATQNALDSVSEIANAAKSKSDDTNIAYGTCSTDAAVAEKVITITNNNWKLKVGSIIVISFTATNTASNPTFNVNNTGAKSIWYNTALITTSNLSNAGYANRPCIYVYDGTQFVFMGWSYDSNSDTKVTQNAAITTAGEYPVLIGYSTSTSKTTNAVNKTSTLKYNPNTKILTAPTFSGNLKGNADTATTLTGLTATVEELNYVDGVKGNIQEQLDGVDNKIKENSDIVTTELSEDITGEEPEINPVLEARLTELNGNLIKLESDLVDKVEQEDLDENVDAKLDAAKADIAQQVIDAFGGIPVFGTVNDDNTITVTSALAEGTYIIKYEMEDGTTSEIGRVTIEADLPIYTNQIPISTDTSGNVYNEVGFKTNYRLNSSGVEAEQAGMCCTGFIPANSEDVIEMKNVTVAGTKTAYIATYKADKSFKQVATIDELFTQDAYGVYRGTVPMSSEIAFIRFSLGTIDTTSIITVNEEIL